MLDKYSAIRDTSGQSGAELIKEKEQVNFTFLYQWTKSLWQCHSKENQSNVNGMDYVEETIRVAISCFECDTKCLGNTASLLLEQEKNGGKDLMFEPRELSSMSKFEVFQRDAKGSCSINFFGI